ncbi:uncharacterized protein [Lepisosteus oculatus]|uniref:uncharacterized protein n=1 Tax=Lepisosteus oculatus TaxID=7918 RepID=UPI00372052E8
MDAKEGNNLRVKAVECKARQSEDCLRKKGGVEMSQKQTADPRLDVKTSTAISEGPKRKQRFEKDDGDLSRDVDRLIAEIEEMFSDSSSQTHPGQDKQAEQTEPLMSCEDSGKEPWSDAGPPSRVRLPRPKASYGRRKKSGGTEVTQRVIPSEKETVELFSEILTPQTVSEGPKRRKHCGNDSVSRDVDRHFAEIEMFSDFSNETHPGRDKQAEQTEPLRSCEDSGKEPWSDTGPPSRVRLPRPKASYGRRMKSRGTEEGGVTDFFPEILTQRAVSEGPKRRQHIRKDDVSRDGDRLMAKIDEMLKVSPCVTPPGHDILPFLSKRPLSEDPHQIRVRGLAKKAQTDLSLVEEFKQDALSTVKGHPRIPFDSNNSQTAKETCAAEELGEMSEQPAPPVLSLTEPVKATVTEASMNSCPGHLLPRIRQPRPKASYGRRITNGAIEVRKGSGFQVVRKIAHVRQEPFTTSEESPTKCNSGNFPPQSEGSLIGPHHPRCLKRQMEEKIPALESFPKEAWAGGNKREKKTKKQTRLISVQAEEDMQLDKETSNHDISSFTSEFPPDNGEKEDNEIHVPPKPTMISTEPEDTLQTESISARPGQIEPMVGQLKVLATEKEVEQEKASSVWKKLLRKTGARKMKASPKKLKRDSESASPSSFKTQQKDNESSTQEQPSERVEGSCTSCFAFLKLFRRKRR